MTNLFEVSTERKVLLPTAKPWHRLHLQPQTQTTLAPLQLEGGEQVAQQGTEVVVRLESEQELKILRAAELQVNLVALGREEREGGVVLQHLTLTTHLVRIIVDEKDKDVEENDALAPHLLLYQLEHLRGVVALHPDDDVHIAVRFLFPSCPVVFLYWIFSH